MVECFLRERAVKGVGNLETLAPGSSMRIHRYRRAWLDGKSRLCGAGAAISSVAPVDADGQRGWAHGSGMFRRRGNGSISCLHVYASVALVCVARCTVSRVSRKVGCVQILIVRGGALQLAKDSFLVVKEVADQAIGMALVHSEGIL